MDSLYKMSSEQQIPSVDSFLDSLRLKQLESLFTSNGIVSVEQLFDFDDAALQRIGVDKHGYRKRMVIELNNLRLRLEILKKGQIKSHENGENEIIPNDQDTLKSVAAKESFQLDVNKDSVELGKPEVLDEAPHVEVAPAIPPKLKSAREPPPAPLPRNVSALNHPGVPEIPPRLDLDEQQHDDTNAHEPNKRSSGSVKEHEAFQSFSSINEIKRAVTIPMPRKRLAPQPPKENASEFVIDKSKVETGSSSDAAGKIEPSEKQQNDLSPEMRPTALSIVKNKEFIGRMNSLILSPARPAPLPPKIVSPVEKDATGLKDEDGSSDSDDESPPGTQELATETPRFLEDELEKIGMTASADRRASKLVTLRRSGFLEKRGGQNNQKRFKRRWVVFDGNDLRYYDKDTQTDCLQIVPLSRMKGVKIASADGKDKKQQLLLETPNRTFIFTSDDHNEIGLWANTLMQAIMLRSEIPETCSEESIGGDMSDPDKEGWLKKQGHNVARDWKDRYIAIKDGKIAYYRNYENYKQGLPINCLNMALSTIRPDASRCRISMLTAQQKDFVFEAKDEQSYQEWEAAFKTSIQIALGDTSVLHEIQENPSNKHCADCGKRNPVWASVNLLVIVCDQCIGFHRKLGAQISKARSILMDVKVWTSSLKQLMKTVGNKKANSFWEKKLPEDDKIKPDSSSEKRYEFIFSKYKEKRYIHFSQYYGQEDNLGMALRENVTTDDVLQTLQLIICGAPIYYTKAGNEDDRSPYELATAVNQELQMELLRQFNGNLTAEEREKEEREEAERIRKASEEAARRNAPPPTTWEKEGILLKRGPKNSEPWRQRMFYLQKRSLFYQRDKEKELIDLREMIDVQLGVNDDDPKTINIVLPNRTFYLKGETPSDAKSWYWAIKNKQVFGVAIENQELNGKKVPHLVAKCIDYVNYYALDEEGIYRKNGSMSTIRAIKQVFNQDAAAVRLTLDEYPFVHNVCGVLKLYFREGLQEPLMTDRLYEKFLKNSVNTDHDGRLTTIYQLLKELPEVNAATLKCLIVHLDGIIRHSEKNLMSKENVNRVFAPIILNQGKSTNEMILSREYAIFDDILTYYMYFFDIDPSEEAKKQEQIENAKRVMDDAMKLKDRMSEGFKIDEIQISVSIQDSQDSCMVKVNKKMTASEVCLYIVKLKSLPADSNWALFQKIKGAGLERPLHTNESVFSLLMESIKLEDQRTYSLKNNYVFEMTAPYQNARLSIRGKLYWKKNDGNWKEHFLVLRTGDLIVSLKEHSSEVEKLSIHQWLLFIGNDERAKKKSPKKYGFTLMSDCEKRYVCTDDEKYLYRWISAILQIKYPNGIWTNLQEAERTMTAITEDLVPLNQRRSMFLGRQSTVLGEQGSSKQVQMELQIKRQSLKRIR
ncbi:arf-GAP with Rho-GAP domain, ANK repeat and PH domain-containing protein 1-like isoform X1 [Rhopilema esculentum]|uniref:arf-GAP with Rho-GAP domain, ANK repeat and PH domain-containing protein 1-like isoform X1 n=1 Tax=Rhopilema esculentum TaxID=499914 RepID=UPI0031D3BAFB